LPLDRLVTLNDIRSMRPYTIYCKQSFPPIVFSLAQRVRRHPKSVVFILHYAPSTSEKLARRIREAYEVKEKYGGWPMSWAWWKPYTVVVERGMPYPNSRNKLIDTKCDNCGSQDEPEDGEREYAYPKVPCPECLSLWLEEKGFEGFLYEIDVSWRK